MLHIFECCIKTPCFADLEPRSILLMTSMYILQRYGTLFFFNQTYWNGEILSDWFVPSKLWDEIWIPVGRKVGMTVILPSSWTELFMETRQRDALYSHGKAIKLSLGPNNCKRQLLKFCPHEKCSS